jgi:hypothetical protein
MIEKVFTPGELLRSNRSDNMDRLYLITMSRWITNRMRMPARQIRIGWKISVGNQPSMAHGPNR